MTETVDRDALRQEYEEHKKKEAEDRAKRDAYDNAPAKVEKRYWKPTTGKDANGNIIPQKHTLRIVPIPGNGGKWYKDYHEAWVNKKPICPPSTVDPEASDPFVPYLAALRAVEGDAGKQAYMSARAKHVAVCFVVDRENEDLGVQKWTLKWREFMQIQSIMYDAEAGEIYNVNDGRDLIVMYTRGDMSGAINISAAFKTSPLGDEDATAEWTALDLWGSYRVGEPSDPEYITAVIEGTVNEFFEQKKAEWAAKKAAEENSTPEEAAPVDAPTHSTQEAAEAAVDALEAFAPKFFVKSPKDGSTLPEPVTLASARADYGPDVEVQDMDMSGWKKLGEVA